MGAAKARFPNRLTLKNNIMNVRSFILSGCLAALTLGAGNQLMAQGRGGPPDPAEMKQRRLDLAHEQLEITNKEDWKAIEPLIGKVIDAQMDLFRGGGAGMFGRGGGRRAGGDNANANGDQPRPQRRNFFGEPSPAMTALRDAIEAKAPTAELKTKLAAVRAENKDREAKLEAAQEELRGVLSMRQEAIAVSNGLLR
jgi:hypothetical protein